MHLVTRARCLRLLNASSTAHDQVRGIGRELQSIVHHTLAQTGETIEANPTLQQGAKGMKASHSHVKKNRRGRDRDLIQGIFTHTKSITDHDHIQMIQGIFKHTKSITDHDHIQLIQRIFTQTKSITGREHHHIQKPEAVTVTCTPDFIHQILCRQNIAQDHYPDCQYVHRKTVTNVQTLPQKIHVKLHNLDRHPVHDREKLANIETLPQANNVRHHDPDPDPIHSREKLTNVDTIPQRKHVGDHDPIHGREKLTNVETFPQTPCRNIRNFSLKQRYQ